HDMPGTLRAPGRLVVDPSTSANARGGLLRPSRIQIVQSKITNRYEPKPYERRREIPYQALGTDRPGRAPLCCRIARHSRQHGPAVASAVALLAIRARANDPLLSRRHTKRPSRFDSCLRLRHVAGCVVQVTW